MRLPWTLRKVITHTQLLIDKTTFFAHANNNITTALLNTTTAVSSPASKSTMKDFSSLGVPTTLLKKTTLVEASNGDIGDGAIERLPVYTLTFAIPPAPSSSTDDVVNVNGFQLKQLHHADINIGLGDVVKMVVPNYKPKSYSVSAIRPNQNEFDVTFKVYPNGRASGYLDRLVVGGGDAGGDVVTRIRSFGKSAGRYRNHGVGDNEEHACIIAYGVGITEGLPVARAELERMARDDGGEGEGDNNNGRCRTRKVTVLWASRTEADTFWRDEIDELRQKYGKEKFELRHVLSRERRDGCYHGRIDPAIVRDAFELGEQNEAAANENDARCLPLFLSVGTKEMMRMTYGMLESMGYPMPDHELLPKHKKTK